MIDLSSLPLDALAERQHANFVYAMALSAGSAIFAAVDQTPLSAIAATAVGIATGYIYLMNRQGKAAIETYFEQRAREEAFNKTSYVARIDALTKQLAEITDKSRTQMDHLKQGVADGASKSLGNEMRMRTALHLIRTLLQRLKLTSEYDELMVQIEESITAATADLSEPQRRPLASQPRLEPLDERG